MKRVNFGALLGAVLALIATFGPWFTGTSSSLRLQQLEQAAWAFLPLLLLGAFCVLGALFKSRWLSLGLVLAGLLGALLGLLAFKDSLITVDATAQWGFWLNLFSFLLVVVGGISKLGVLQGMGWSTRILRDFLPPASIPLLLFLSWEALTEGLRIPMAFFPRISDIYQVLISAYGVLIADSIRTFFKQVLIGYLVGVTSGMAVGLVVAFSLFLRRGFLPLATALSAIPIVGLAPVLGRAFGVDWESKAAVAVIVSFFPVVINVVQGLTTIDPLKLDLMHSYAAGNRDILFKLRLPNALPYVFNALKIASIIVLISVIVSEFLIPGPPLGLGQRISLSARSGRYDVTFAAITFASIIGILFYNAIVLLERAFTSWHSSFREK